MNLEAYEREGRGLYAEFAGTVASILAAAVKADPKLRLQQVQHRAKHPASLRKKLDAVDGVGRDDIERVAKDLAGCRLVFYTNADVRRFTSSGIVNENFEIDWDRSKIHHPDADAKSASELFMGDNLVVRLNAQRTALPEYARFNGLSCEVQIQTTLNHAWSEMAHDIIYKKPALAGFGNRLMEGIDKRMVMIMREYLLPAGYEFQKVVDDVERLSAGKELFDRGALEALDACDDNNARYDLLQRFNTYVLPSYDDLDRVQDDIRSAMVRAIEQARATTDRPIETPLGQIEGLSADVVIDAALDVIDQLRYRGVEATFDALCRIYMGATSDQQRKRTLESVELLSKHELSIWRHSGPAVQGILLARIERLTPTELDAVKPVILEVLEQILEPTVSGSTSTFDQVTLHTGSVRASDELRELRSKAVDLLKGLFDRAEADSDRLAVIHALSIATTTPRAGKYPNDVLRIILDNTRDIVSFYTGVAAGLSLELLQKLEHDVFWWYRRMQNVPPDLATAADLSQAQEQLSVAILNFRDHINQSHDFNVYKTLVGHQSIFPPAWDNEGFRWQEQQKYRDERIARFVGEVTEANADQWLATLIRCAQTESADWATFPNFGRFLEELGRAKPSIMLSYLDRLDARLARFLPSILSGLEASEKSNVVPPMIERWIADKQYLAPIIWHQRFSKHLSGPLLIRAFTAALEDGDTHAIRNAVSASVERQGTVPDDLVSTVFLPAITYLAARPQEHWPNAIRMQAANEAMFAGLTAEQADQVLKTLLHANDIDHSVEEPLAAMAESWPDKVIDFFGARLRVDTAGEHDHRYEPIPFELDKLRAPLARVWRTLLTKIRSWFDEDRTLFAYRGGRLLSRAFPQFSPELEAHLMRIAEEGRRDDLEFLIAILHGYDGQPFILGICKSIIASLAPDDPLLKEVDALLDATGTVMGDFGFVEAYKRKKDEIEPWLAEPREHVRSFAKRRLLSLDRQVAAEQRRSEQDLELRKRRDGESGK